MNMADWNTYKTTFDTANLSSSAVFHHQIKFVFGKKLWLERVIKEEDGQKHTTAPATPVQDGKEKFKQAQQY